MARRNPEVPRLLFNKRRGLRSPTLLSGLLILPGLTPTMLSAWPVAGSDSLSGGRRLLFIFQADCRYAPQALLKLPLHLRVLLRPLIGRPLDLRAFERHCF
jgi:hypothetical protein